MFPNVITYYPYDAGIVSDVFIVLDKSDAMRVWQSELAAAAGVPVDNKQTFEVMDIDDNVFSVQFYDFDVYIAKHSKRRPGKSIYKLKN